ncbi:MAG: glycosyltransferase family 2 protein [Betaproteobacteria bacterium]
MAPDSNSRRVPISLVLITRDAGAQLHACLNSARFADEILIVDSGSVDDTVQIAASFGARVVDQSWLGYGPQKQFAVARAVHDWVLCLDADERVTPVLRASIEAALIDPAFVAYRMARCNRFLGRWLRHGEGYPDWSVRLFDRRHARWSDDAVHERVLIDGPAGTVTGDLRHESAESLDEYLAKQNRYTTLQAGSLHAQGRRASVLQMLLSPAMRFVKFYFIRLGFLDGVAGLIHIAIGAGNSFVKYAKLLALERNAREAAHS